MDLGTYRPGGLSPRSEARLRRLRRAVGVTVLLLLALGILAGRFWLGADRKDAALARGAEALHRALQGEDAAWDEARAAYGEAAGDALVDPYPLFALEVTRGLEGGEPEAATPAAGEVFRALADGRFDVARARLEEVEPGRGRDLLERLVEDVGAYSDSSPE